MSSTVRAVTALLTLIAATAPLVVRAGDSAGKSVIQRLLEGEVPFAAAAEPKESGALLLEPTAPEALRFELWFLPEDLGKLDAAPEPGADRLTITGAYSSGERFAPEGFVIRGGDPTHPYPQGWDGLLLVDAEGRATLHDVSRVRHEGAEVNLRDAEARKAFLAKAKRAGISAIQSHLLINEGRLDLKPSPTARRYRRRLLFETRDGRFGVWDSSPAMMTLYEAAKALAEAEDPRMALNLDMGTYDFCERAKAGSRENCGRLSRQEIEKLTNLVAISRRPSPGAQPAN